jgi:parallel beta-helix repeat protein
MSDDIVFLRNNVSDAFNGIYSFDTDNLTIQDSFSANNIGGGGSDICTTIYSTRNVTITNFTANLDTCGIAIESVSKNVSIYNSTFKNNKNFGIYVSGTSSATIIQNNTVQNNSDGIHLIASSNVTVFNNTFLLNRNYGAQVRTASYGNHNFTQNVFLLNSLKGFYLENSLNNTFINNNITSTSTCISLSNSSQGTFINSTLYNCTSSDFDSSDGSINNLVTNVSLDRSKVTFGTGFSNPTAGNNLTMQWYLRIKVVNSTSPISDAIVNVTNATNVPTNPMFLNQLTDANGFTNFMLVTEFVGNATNNVNYTPHNLTVNTTDTGYKNQNVTMFSSQTITFVLVKPSNVSLSTPAHSSQNVTSIIPFGYYANFSADLANASVFINKSGWTRVAGNMSNVINDSLNWINYTPTAPYGSVISWGVQVCTSTASVCTFSTNYTHTVYEPLSVNITTNKTNYNASERALFIVNISNGVGTPVANVNVNLTLKHPNTTIIQSWNDLVLGANGITSVVYEFTNIQANGTYTLNATTFNISTYYANTSNTTTFNVNESYSFSNTPATQVINIQANTILTTGITLQNPNASSFGNQNLTINQDSNLSWATVDTPSKVLNVSTSNTTTITFDATGVAVGNYVARINFSDSNGNTTNRTTLFSITVTAAPVPNLVINESVVSKTVNRNANFESVVNLSNSGGGAAIGVTCWIDDSHDFITVSPPTVGNIASLAGLNVIIMWNMTSVAARGAYSSTLTCNTTDGGSEYQTTIYTSVQAPSLYPNPTFVSPTLAPGFIYTCGTTNLPCFDIQNNGEVAGTDVNCTATGALSAWVTAITPNAYALNPTQVKTMTYSISVPAGVGDQAITIPVLCSSSNYADNATINLNIGVNTPGGGGGGGGGPPSVTIFGNIFTITPNTVDITGQTISNPLQGENNGCFTYRIKNDIDSPITFSYEFDPQEIISEDGSRYVFKDVIKTDPAQPFIVKPSLIQNLLICIRSPIPIQGVLETNMLINGQASNGKVNVKSIHISAVQNLIGLNISGGNLVVQLVFVAFIALIIYFVYRLATGQAKLPKR